MKRLLILSYLLVSGFAYAQMKEKFVVNFDYNKFELSGVATSKIDSALSSGSIAQIRSVDLYGHCDSIGNDSYNNVLSENRVKSVKTYLLAHGISTKVLGAQRAFGKRQPLNSNATPDERSFNRRVEINISRTQSKVGETTTVAKSSNPGVLEAQIADSTTKKGSNLVLRNLQFVGGRHFLMKESLPALLELLAVLKAHPTLEIEIQGHICCTYGSEDGIDIDNGTPYLSVNRAKAIYDYLVGNGIDATRLAYKGFGHSMPLVYPEDTEERRTTNRRVQIKILTK